MGTKEVDSSAPTAHFVPGYVYLCTKSADRMFHSCHRDRDRTSKGPSIFFFDDYGSLRPVLNETSIRRNSMTTVRNFPKSENNKIYFFSRESHIVHNS